MICFEYLSIYFEKGVIHYLLKDIVFVGYFQFLALSGAQEMQIFICLSVRTVKSVLEQALSGLSMLTSSDRRSLK